MNELRGKCRSKPGNPAFWKEVCGIGRDLSLISSKEAKKQGGVSSVTEKEAAEVSYLITLDTYTTYELGVVHCILEDPCP